MVKPRILLLDDNLGFAEALQRSLRGRFQVRHAKTLSDAQAAMDLGIDLALVDIVLDEQKTREDRSGLHFISWASKDLPDIPLIVLTGYGADELEVDALRVGAADYIEKDDLNLKLLEAKILALLDRKALLSKARVLERRLEEYEPHTLVGESPPIVALREQIHQFAETYSTVFIVGETGVGKEVVARAIHMASNRSTKPYLPINCASLSAGLLDSELFGHERGAFTGAHQRRIGMFEEATGGTLLLDEITEMDTGLQAKLLRTLQEKKIKRVGSSKQIDVDVRIIATTNRNPEVAVTDGKLRKDLYYRLNVLLMQIPPLRERKEDIPLLVQHFLNGLERRVALPRKHFANSAINLLQEYSWPGNVRELENVVERAFALSLDDEIACALIAPWLGTKPKGGGHVAPSEGLDIEHQTAWIQLKTIAEALHKTGGGKHEAQQLLGFKDRSTMRRTIYRLRRNYPDLWEKFPLLERNYPR